MRIDELFTSIQGEGMWLGTPSVFVRTAGCNLDCHWCDTPRAKTAAMAREMTVSELAAAVARTGLEHVVITGGEPTLYPSELIDLCALLRSARHVTTLETNATAFVPCDADLHSLSPKLHSAHLAPRAAWHDEVIARYAAAGREWQLKIVVGTRNDATQALNRLDALNLSRSRVFLMPQARTREKHAQIADWLVPLCCKEGCRFGARLQTLLWNNAPGR
ncbi:7-carboxy-7-deazaguanine synthase QueE [bacterium]|nr:7-carboxy-7-deazaguanine synthase QueE [bacterium]